MRISRFFVALAVAGAATLLIVLPATARISRHANTRAAAATVTVSAKEFRFSLSTKTAKRGLVTFRVTNKGKLAHDFKINGKKTPLLRPGQSASLSVRFTKKGNYAYICTVAGHAASGMKGVFKIT